VRVPEVVNVCVPVMVNHGVPVGACVRACVRACVQQETGQYIQVCPPINILLSVQWVPARPLVVGWLA
jgi:hypothetical protein